VNVEEGGCTEPTCVLERVAGIVSAALPRVGPMLGRHAKRFVLPIQVEYLNPQDPLYFAAGGKCVSISDYSLELARLPTVDGE